jgi:aspartate/methionine/tyrosine aminotransferase
MENLAPYYLAVKWQEIKEQKALGEHVLNLAIGNPEENPRDDVIAQLHDTINRSGFHGYQPYQGTSSFLTAWSAWLQKHFSLTTNPTSELLVTQGAREAIHLINMAFVDKNDTILVPDPGYALYRQTGLMYGANIQPYQLKASNQWLPDFDQLEQPMFTEAKLMWLNYPHMPTGAIANQNFWDKLMVWSQKHEVILVHDNPYGLIRNEKPVSVFHQTIGELPVMEIHSLSKSYNMAGWRIGAIAGRSDLIKSLLNIKTYTGSGTFLPLQYAAETALMNDDSWIEARNIHFNKNASLAKAFLRRLGCTTFYDQAGMFVWAKAPKEFAAGETFANYLLQVLGIFVAPGHIFGEEGAPFVRISLGVRESTMRQATQRVLSSIQSVEV